MNASLVAIRRPLVGMPKFSSPNLQGLPRAQLVAWVYKTLGGPSFRGRQIFEWLHRHRAGSFDEMTNLSKAVRQGLAERTQLRRLTVGEIHRAQDGTRKLQLKTHDGHAIESVLIPNPGRGLTLCVSSMVGCSLTCRFCATASLGFQRNLATWEIVDQVYQAQDLLLADAQGRPDRHPRLTNLVFMGMGEPLHNFNQVRDSIRILTDPLGSGIAARRMTLSTAGLVPGIKRFAKDGLGQDVGLAISLNAPNDTLRDQIMPINTRWPLASLMEAVHQVPTPKRRRITFEYVLLSEVNDQDHHAQALVRLLRGLPCQVNAIPFNPHPHAPYQRPKSEAVERFVNLCRRGGLTVYIRTPRGDDIGAACGQLALKPKTQT